MAAIVVSAPTRGTEIDISHSMLTLLHRQSCTQQAQLERLSSDWADNVSMLRSPLSVHGVGSELEPKQQRDPAGRGGVLSLAGAQQGTLEQAHVPSEGLRLHLALDGLHNRSHGAERQRHLQPHTTPAVISAGHIEIEIEICCN